jgi:hypothetical protein
MHFWNSLLQALHDTVLDSKLTFFTDEAWFHFSRYTNSQNSRYWSSSNTRQIFAVPLHNQKMDVWCAITAARIVGPTFCKTLLFKSKRETFWAPNMMMSFSNYLFTFRNVLCVYNVQHINCDASLLFLGRCAQADGKRIRQFGHLQKTLLDAPLFPNIWIKVYICLTYSPYI